VFASAAPIDVNAETAKPIAHTPLALSVTNILASADLRRSCPPRPVVGYNLVHRRVRMIHHPA